MIWIKISELVSFSIKKLNNNTTWIITRALITNVIDIDRYTSLENVFSEIFLEQESMQEPIYSVFWGSRSLWAARHDVALHHIHTNRPNGVRPCLAGLSTFRNQFMSSSRNFTVRHTEFVEFGLLNQVEFRFLEHPSRIATACEEHHFCPPRRSLSNFLKLWMIRSIHPDISSTVFLAVAVVVNSFVTWNGNEIAWSLEINKTHTLPRDRDGAPGARDSHEPYHYAAPLRTEHGQFMSQIEIESVANLFS
jgi:hypothetical protein